MNGELTKIEIYREPILEIIESVEKKVNQLQEELAAISGMIYGAKLGLLYDAKESNNDEKGEEAR